MYKIRNHIGIICVREKYLKSLIWSTVTECFGVADMEYSCLKEKILDRIMIKGYRNKGIIVSFSKNSIKINLHIKVTIGSNISAVAENIHRKLDFVIEQATGIKNREINIFVENIKI